MSEVLEQGREIRNFEVYRTGRPNKISLDFFPHSTSLSESEDILVLQGKCGLMGYGIYLKLLEAIYQGDGYYLVFDDKAKYRIAHQVNIDFSQLVDIVNFCVGPARLFDDLIYSEYAVLTSAQIQDAYFTACKRRKDISAFFKFLLVDPDEYGIAVTDIVAKSTSSYLSKQRNRKSIRPSVRYEVMHRDKFRCVICGKTSKEARRLEIDHILPVVAGGGNETENLRTLCWECNAGKGVKIEGVRA